MSNAHFIFADYYEMAIYHVTTTRINFASSNFGRDIQGLYKMWNDPCNPGPTLVGTHMSSR